MKFKKFLNALTPVAFFLFIILFAAATLVLPKEDFSEQENRSLAKMPMLNAKSWFSGEFSDGLGKFLCEHFPLRNSWISLRTALERHVGHDEVNGIYFSDGCLYEAPQEYDYEIVDRSIAAINSLGERLGGRLSVMIVPTSVQLYSDRLPEYAPKPEQRDLINYIYSGLSDNVTAVDVYDLLYQSRDDYIFYRTDHHWTTRGAYIGYLTLMSAYGYEPVSLDKINIEHASHSFFGTYYSKVQSGEARADTIDFYTSSGPVVNGVMITHPDGTVTEHDDVYFRENLAIKDKYLSFLGENVPKVDVYSEYSGGSILIIKDSFANCFVPFLTKHFEKVTAVDLRYMMDLKDYVSLKDYDRVLILYNAETFASDCNIAKLSLE